MEWGANWLLALENLVDLMHAPFLHARSITLNEGITNDRVAVDDHDDGFEVRRRDQAGTNFDWIDIHTGDLSFVRLDIPLPPSAGPGPPLRILGFLTPRDNAATLVHFPPIPCGVGPRASYSGGRCTGCACAAPTCTCSIRTRRCWRVCAPSRKPAATSISHRPTGPVVHLRRALEPAFTEQRQRFGLEEPTRPVPIALAD